MSAVKGAGERLIIMRDLGQVKNRVSVELHMQPPRLNTWLYTLTPIAIRSNVIQIPVSICLLRPAHDALIGRSVASVFSTFERIKEELEENPVNIVSTPKAICGPVKGLS